jgi:hypothetical protein
MLPWQAEGFEWNDGNESELWGHRIEPWEVEEVFLNDPVWRRNKRDRSGDYKMMGVSDGGRYLTIVVAVSPTDWSLRAVTGWDSTPRERNDIKEKRQ